MISVWSILTCCMFSWNTYSFHFDFSLSPPYLTWLIDYLEDTSLNCQSRCLPGDSVFKPLALQPLLSASVTVYTNWYIYLTAWYLTIPERTYFFQVSNALLGTTHVICLRQETLYPWTIWQSSLEAFFSGKHNTKQLQESDESSSGNRHLHICFYLCSWHCSKWTVLKTHWFHLEKKLC